MLAVAPSPGLCVCDWLTACLGELSLARPSDYNATKPKTWPLNRGQAGPVTTRINGHMTTAPQHELETEVRITPDGTARVNSAWPPGCTNSRGLLERSATLARCGDQ